MDPVVDDDDDDVKDELALAPTSADPEHNGDAVYCRDCEMWLNGPTQWEDHKVGKKHKRNFKRQLAGGQTIGQKNIQKKEKAPAAKNARDAPAPQHEAPTHYQAAWPWPTPDHYGLQWPENLQEAYRQPEFWQQQQAQAQAQQLLFCMGYSYGF